MCAKSGFWNLESGSGLTVFDNAGFGSALSPCESEISRIRIFSIPDPVSNNLSILTPKKIVPELPEICSVLFIPDLDPDLSTHPGYRVEKGSATLNYRVV